MSVATLRADANVLSEPSSSGFDPESQRMAEKIKESIDQIRSTKSITLGQSLYEAYKSLSEICAECSLPDWDGYDAKAITPDAYQEAQELIKRLPSSIPAPEIIPEPTGSIAFQWQTKPGKIFVVSVSGKSNIAYAGIFGTGKVQGSEYFRDMLPATLIPFFNRLYK